MAKNVMRLSKCLQRAFQGCVLAQTVWAEPHLTPRPSLSCLRDKSCNIFTSIGKTQRKKGLGNNGSSHICVRGLLYSYQEQTGSQHSQRSNKQSMVPCSSPLWLQRKRRATGRIKPTLFNIKGDENQPEHATRIVNESTKNHNDPKAKKKGSTMGFVYEMHSDPLKKYIFASECASLSSSTHKQSGIFCS